MADETVIKHWIIVREPGCVPEKKRPIEQTHEGVIEMLRELVDCRPEGTDLTVAMLTWNHDLWVQDGREALAIAEDTAPAERAQTVRQFGGVAAGLFETES